MQVSERFALHVVRHGHGRRLNFAPAIVTGRRFTSAFLEPGIVDYSDIGVGRELLRKETIDAALATMGGIPVTIGHVRVNAANRMRVANGSVLTAYYNPSTGWYECKGENVTDEVIRRVNAGETVSVAYQVLATGPGGTYHGIRYNRELTRIRFEHLAIVENPRYEGATIRLNSKNKPTMNILKLFQKKPAAQANAGQPAATPAADKAPANADSRENSASEIPEDSSIEIDGKPVSLKELVDGYRANAAPSTETPEEITSDAEVEVDGKRVTVAELVDAHRANAKGKRENGEDESEDEKKEREAKERENARAKAGTFRVLRDARTNGKHASPGVKLAPGGGNSMSEKLARGVARYSIKPAGK